MLQLKHLLLIHLGLPIDLDLYMGLPLPRPLGGGLVYGLFIIDCGLS